MRFATRGRRTTERTEVHRKEPLCDLIQNPILPNFGMRPSPRVPLCISVCPVVHLWREWSRRCRPYEGVEQCGHGWPLDLRC